LRKIGLGSLVDAGFEVRRGRGRGNSKNVRHKKNSSTFQPSI